MRILQLLPRMRSPRGAADPAAGSGYVLLAAEIDAHPPFLSTSRTKRLLLEDCARWCARVAQEAACWRP